MKSGSTCELNTIRPHVFITLVIIITFKVMASKFGYETLIKHRLKHTKLIGIISFGNSAGFRAPQHLQLRGELKILCRLHTNCRNWFKARVRVSRGTGRKSSRGRSLNTLLFCHVWKPKMANFIAIKMRKTAEFKLSVIILLA